MGERYYDPILARFTQTDPQTTCGGNTMSVDNRYAYANDDPTTLSDPNGTHAHKRYHKKRHYHRRVVHHRAPRKPSPLTTLKRCAGHFNAAGGYVLGAAGSVVSGVAGSPAVVPLLLGAVGAIYFGANAEIEIVNGVECLRGRHD